MNSHGQHLIDRVRILKGQGRKNRDIGMSVGLTESQVKSLCHHRGLKRPVSGRLEVPVGAKVINALQIEATARGERFDNFIRRLLLTITRDNLYSAIIDDGK